MHAFCMYIQQVHIQHLLYFIPDFQMEFIFIKENREFTDIDSNIDSNKNINLLPNDRNFETLYLPK